MLLLAWGLWKLEPAGFRRMLRDIGELYLAGFACFAPIALVPAEALGWRFALSLVAAALFVAVALWRHRGLYRAFLAFD
jgi:hypothetical protein